MTVAIKQMKNVGLMKRYWATLGRVYPNTEYGSARALSEALQVYCGFGFRDTVGGIMQAVPRGISNMDKAEFEAFYELAMAYIWKTWGIDVEKMDQENVNLMRDEGL